MKKALVLALAVILASGFVAVAGPAGAAEYDRYERGTTAPPPPPPPPPAASAARPAAATTARSLDLPPGAAAWRESRRAPAGTRVRFLPVGPEAAPVDPEDDDDDWYGDDERDGEAAGRAPARGGLAGLASLVAGRGRRADRSPRPPAADVRDRVAGMLERERDG